MSWYFVDSNGGTKGPMDISRLKMLYNTEVSDTTYLWDGINIHQWTELHKLPSLHKQVSNTVNTDGLTPDDIDDMLDEIDIDTRHNSSEEKQYEPCHVYIQNQSANKQSKPKRNRKLYTQAIRSPTLPSHLQSFHNINTSNSNSNSQSTNNNPNFNINWREIYLHRQSILDCVESGDIDINVQNPSDGMTLLMHSIIIGDYNLCVIIINYGADIFIKDNDGDDALDYALVFQRYKVTQLLLILGFKRKQKNVSISEALSEKNKQAKYMMHPQFGRFKEKIVQFVTKAIKEKQSFDINLLYFAWYFTVNMKDIPSNASVPYSQLQYNKRGSKKIIKYNPYKDPLQSKLFKIMMKTYWEIISNKSSNAREWRWLRTHFIDSLVWCLPHPDNMDKSECESDDSETVVSEDINDNKGSLNSANMQNILAQIVESSDKMLFFLFL